MFLGRGSRGREKGLLHICLVLCTPMNALGKASCPVITSRNIPSLSHFEINNFLTMLTQQCQDSRDSFMILNLCKLSSQGQIEEQSHSTGSTCIIGGWLAISLKWCSKASWTLLQRTPGKETPAVVHFLCKWS